MDAVPAAIEGLRPGQTGVVVLGRVIIGDIAVSSLAARFGKALDETRKVLIRDAVHQGWLRHLRHDQRTAEAEELAGHVRSFRRDLRRLVADGDQRALSGQLLPYALRFGLLSDQGTPLVRFTQAWVRAFAELPGWAPPKPARPEYVSDQPLFGEVPPGAGMMW
jgi:HAMP domain-containing protein